MLKVAIKTVMVYYNSIYFTLLEAEF